ncbi:TetR/AcrR family transcriptional regulator [Streptomyces sp. NPDC057694]|uniref:TetR/AcrR family transcriptional regulator n=1 Tax=Streptomyces sp. NPDC057694 TaxID=3346216 RepID=UPI00367DB9E3
MSDKPTRILQAAARLIARRGVRGLRVERVAAEAKVSTALIYYHYSDRTGLLRRTLEFINERAVHYTDAAFDADADPLAQLSQMLRLELQDDAEVRENSAAWGELRATAVFDAELREQLAAATARWVADLAGLIDGAKAAGQVATGIDSAAAAERLTAQVEGLSMRWLSGSTTLERARALLAQAVALELGTGRAG